MYTHRHTHEHILIKIYINTHTHFCLHRCAVGTDQISLWSKQRKEATTISISSQKQCSSYPLLDKLLPDVTGSIFPSQKKQPKKKKCSQLSSVLFVFAFFFRTKQRGRKAADVSRNGLYFAGCWFSSRYIHTSQPW